MKRALTCSLVIFLAVSMFMPAFSSAQEDETMYLYGTVSGVSDNTVTVTEIGYDEETGDEIYLENIYRISPETELENIESVTMLETGDEVEIEYVEKDGGKEIQYLFVYVADE